MFDIRSILSSKIAAAVAVIIIVLVISLYVSAKVIDYKNAVIEKKNEKIMQQDYEKEVMKEITEIRVFETNTTAIINTQKEIKDEEVPDSIGIHTIIFD